jgi:YVTN family beta-propeller protein
VVFELPSGTVTFLFTDIEGSTRLLKQLRDRYSEALGEHQTILREAFAEHGGREIDTQGDSFFVAFRRAKDAVAAALAAQRNLAEHPWPDGLELRVRMGIHTGEPTVGEERYVGLGVHRAARICAAGHGGQVLVSQTSRELLRDDPLPEVSLRDLGAHQLKDLDEPEHLYQLVAPGLAETFPPLKTADHAPFAGQEDRLARAVEGGRRRRRLTLLTAVLGAALVGAVVWLLAMSGGTPAPTSVQANALAVIDSQSGEISSQIPVGAAPSGVAVDADSIWVTNRDDQSVSQVRLQTSAVNQTIHVGAGPAGIAIGAGQVWVLNGLDGDVSRIDPEKGVEVDRITAGNGPTAIAYGLGAVWVANGGDATVSKIDSKTGAVVQTLDAVPGATAIAVDFRSLWVVSERMGNVSRLDPQSGAVVRVINVGNGPRAIALGAGSVWVANHLDGTVSRIDPETNNVTATISTGDGPIGLAVGAENVWVANEVDATLSRIDAASNRVELTVPLGNPPQGVAISGDSVLLAVRATGASHRGGTLTVYAGSRGLNSIDPSLSYETYNLAIPSLTNDGLVGNQHVGGSDGSILVPDLAVALPLPTDEGKTYTFQLRSGIRYSTGQTVRAEDIRRAIERAFRVSSPSSGVYYSGIVGAARCAKAPTTCDLSRGIEVDDEAGLVTFHVTAPDPDFLYKLAVPSSEAIPPGIPDRDVGSRPVPATGPYRITEYVPHRSLVFERNPYFREWSPDRPNGYPDRIVWRLDVKADAATRAVERGEADVAYDFVPPELLTEAQTQYASQLYLDPVPGTHFFLLNSNVPPFDDVRVRQALNYAVDRDAVLELARGAGVAQPTCQVLPPNFPGYRPYCPYTANPTDGGQWVAPDLDRAEQLVAASGTKGQPVLVWANDKAVGQYVVDVLRALGYEARLRAFASFDEYDAELFKPENFATFGVAQLQWFPDYPAASGFIDAGIFNCSYFCDRAIDSKIARAKTLQATDPMAASALWARIDRDLTDQAPWLFLYNNKQPDFVSSRVGNFQYNLQYGILLDQLWVK